MDLPTPEDLKERRNELGLTQAELAERADVSQPLIARVEGNDVDPRLSTLRRIVAALDEAEGEVVRAADLMNETVISVGPDDPLNEAVRKMEEEAYSQLPVIEDGVPVGSISQDDLVHVGEEARDDPVREHMSDSFPTVSPDTTEAEIRSRLEHNKALIVTEDGETVGIITGADVAARLS